MVRIIPELEDIAKCVWKELLLDKKSSTRDTFLNIDNKRKHPLYKCSICTGYETIKCVDYRVITNAM